MKVCEKFFVENIRNFCMKFTDPNFLLHGVVQNIVPPLKCPIAAGNYTMARTDIDLRVFSFLPMDGFIFCDVIKITTTVPATKARKLVFCIRIEQKVEKVRIKN
jgi:hypothetical protein